MIKLKLYIHQLYLDPFIKLEYQHDNAKMLY